MIVIAGGHVVESGTHDELQAIEAGVYRRLASRQFRE
jgi:ABC-type multidrug transport system fused ATPase/permease subunit